MLESYKHEVVTSFGLDDCGKMEFIKPLLHMHLTSSCKGSQGLDGPISVTTARYHSTR